MATLERFYTGCSTFWRPEWRRNRRRANLELLESIDDSDPELIVGEPQSGVHRKSPFRDPPFSFFRAGSRTFSCSLAFCFCMISIVLFLDRTIYTEIREQQFTEGSSRSAKLVYDHTQHTEAANFGSIVSNFKSPIASGVHTSVLTLTSPLKVGFANSSTNSQETGVALARNVSSNASEVKESGETWGTWNRTRPTRRLLKTKGALKGLGITFRRGSRAMNELVVAHLDEQSMPVDLKLFLRTLHRSGVTARADVVILSPRGLGTQFKLALRDEEKSFWRLMLQQQPAAPIHMANQQSISTWPLSRKTNGAFPAPGAVAKQTRQMSLPEKLISELKDAGVEAKNGYHVEEIPHESFAPSPFRSPSTLQKSAPKSLNGSFLNCFNVKAFWRSKEEDNRARGKTKGRRGVEIQWENTDLDSGEEAQKDEAAADVRWGNWGSIIVFDMLDLGSEEILSRFIENPPASLQRWMCYELLLGMVRRQYSLVLLTEIRGVVLLGDVMSSGRNTAAASAGSAFLFSEDRTWGQAYHEEIKSLETNPNGNSRQNRKSQQLENVTSLQSGPFYSGKYRRSFIRSVYGTKTWQKLEEEDFQKPILVSGILLGNMKTVQSLSRAMASEILRVAATLRKSREPFPDQPVLNYMVQKSTILGNKLKGKLIFVPKELSRIRTVTNAKQDFFFSQHTGGVLHALHALHGFKDGLVSKAIGDRIIQTIHAQICSSAGASEVYDDCHEHYVP